MRQRQAARLFSSKQTAVCDRRRRGKGVLRKGILKAAAASAAAGASLFFHSAAIAQDAGLMADAKAFGARDAVIRPDLSADGSRVIYITPGPARSSIAVIGNLDTGQYSQVASSNGDPDILRWCNFVSTSRSVCQITGNNIDNLVNVIGFSRLVSINNDGSDPKLLGQTDSFYDAHARQYDGDIIDWLEGTTGQVLMQRTYIPEEGKLGTRLVRTKSGLAVDRLNASTLSRQIVEEPRTGAGDYMSDGLGHVRLLEVPDVTPAGFVSGQIRYLYRTVGANDWKPLTTADYQEFQPLAIDAETDQLYALKKKDGRYALYGIKLDGSLTQKLVAANSHVDIDDVVRFGDGQRVIGYTYAEEQGVVVYFDPEFKALSDGLSRALPQFPIVEFVDSSHDGRKLLIHAGSDRDPGQYYMFDRDKKSLTPAMVDRPELEGRVLASVKAVTISAPDGAQIPAYLTLPPGKDPKKLPAVVLPHGGPSARDYWGFDWLAQFLAARGYAVIQPEYRGSAGWGDAWLNQNGFKNWRTSIGDITASAKWLSQQGIADPDRLAILGWSYGGYAALQSAATEPTLYKAVVAIAPVTDLAMLKDDAQYFVNKELVEREIGAGPHVAEGSPLRHPADIVAPVLLFHGDRDSNVHIAHSQKMDAALKAAGHTSNLTIFKGLDHQLDDSTARASMLASIGQLLDQTIGH
jgi:dipeptidyl aminopeptidase/acylaminoacyl peptidase